MIAKLERTLRTYSQNKYQTQNSPHSQREQQLRTKSWELRNERAGLKVIARFKMFSGH